MTHEEFDILVGKVERGIGRDPMALRRRVAFLALTGYVGLLVWLVLVLLISACFFATMFWVESEGKIICGVLGTATFLVGGWAAIRAMLVRLDPPDGRELKREEAPELFAVLDELRARLKSAPFHRVMLVGECNAAVIQMPRLGVLGWPKNHLMLGMPLLDGLSRDEMRAVLAHEFVHLSREHGRFSHWLYRLRRSWEVVFKQLSQPQVKGHFTLRSMVVKFVEWFWPRFNAHAFVLSRANEYEADAQAARLAGQNNMADALIRLKLLARQIEQKFWPELWQKANENPEPPMDAFQQLRTSLQRGTTPEDRTRWMAEALRATSTNSDTHPCLTERLRALGIILTDAPAHISGAASPSAAETLLGGGLESLRQDVQKKWQKQVEPHWRERHGRAKALMHRLSSLEGSQPASVSDVDSLWDRVVVLMDLKGDEPVEPLLRQILARRPDHAPASFQLGRILLESGNAEGEMHLEHAAAVNEEIIPQVCTLLHRHYRLLGRADKIRELGVRMDRFEKAMASSRAERMEVSAKDVLIPHTLTQAELQNLRQLFEKESELVAVQLAQKQMHYFPKQRFFLLCAHRRQSWHRLPDDDEDRGLVRRLSQNILIPGRVLVFTPSGSFRALAGKLRRVSNVDVWRRE